MRKLLAPLQVKGSIMVRFYEAPGSSALCLYIGTNATKASFDKTQDKEHVLRVWEEFGLPIAPRWLRPIA